MECLQAPLCTPSSTDRSWLVPLALTTLGYLALNPTGSLFAGYSISKVPRICSDVSLCFLLCYPFLAVDNCHFLTFLSCIFQCLYWNPFLLTWHSSTNHFSARIVHCLLCFLPWYLLDSTTVILSAIFMSLETHIVSWSSSSWPVTFPLNLTTSTWSHKVVTGRSSRSYLIYLFQS